MPNPKASAKLFIKLAEAGKSFEPYIPKRRSDQVGLFREILRQCYSHRIECFSYKLPIGKEHMSQSRLKDVLAAPGSKILIANGHGPCMLCEKPPGEPNISPEAKARLFVFFSPLFEDSQLRIMLKGLFKD